MSSITLALKRRVIAYIDGFNFYFGLRANKWKQYYWLDYPLFAKNITRKLSDIEIIQTKLFTARISSPEDKRLRQHSYLEVLAMRGGIDIIFGNYRETSYNCSGCQRPNFLPNEKQTDVNIAVQMMTDAYEDNFDLALLVGGDSDLVPPIKAIKTIFPKKEIVACFPPGRHSKEIRAIVNGQIHFNELDLKHSQLPEVIRRMDGFEYRCPESWR